MPPVNIISAFKQKDKLHVFFLLFQAFEDNCVSFDASQWPTIELVTYFEQCIESIPHQ